MLMRYLLFECCVNDLFSLSDFPVKLGFDGVVFLQEHALILKSWGAPSNPQLERTGISG